MVKLDRNITMMPKSKSQTLKWCSESQNSNSRLEKVLHPVILLMKYSGLRPKILKSSSGQLIHSLSGWKNLTWGECILISLEISYIATALFPLFSPLSILSACVVMLGIMSRSASVISVLHLFLHQKELKTITQELEDYISNTETILNERKIKKRIFPCLLLVLLLAGFMAGTGLKFAISATDNEMRLLFKDFMFGLNVSTQGETNLARFLIFAHCTLFSYLQFLLPASVQLLFIVFCLVLEECVENLYSEEKFLDQEFAVSSFYLKVTIKRQRSLFLILEKINSVFSKMLIGWYSAETSHLIIGIPFTLLMFQEKGFVDAFNIATVVFSLFSFLIITFCGSAIQETHDGVHTKMLRVVQEGRGRNREDYFQKLCLLGVLDESRMDISVAGFFNIQKGIVLTVFANTVTFVVILLQMAHLV